MILIDRIKMQTSDKPVVFMLSRNIYREFERAGRYGGKSRRRDVLKVAMNKLTNISGRQYSKV